VLECSPTEAFQVDVVDEMLAEFQEQVQWRSHLDKSTMRICDLIPGPPSSLIRLADCLEEAIGWLSDEREVSGGGH
jgi:hypothetical protein